MEMERSEALFAAQEPSAGLAYLVRAARRAAMSSTIASRVHSALTYHQYGIQLTAPLAHRDEVESAEFSPDGRRVVTASKDHSARIWDPSTGQPVTEPLLHGDAVASAHFSPDGRRVLTASKDGTARVWDAQTGQLAARLIQHPAPIHSARFSADGLRLVTASEDGTAVVWDAQTGDAVTAPLSHQGAVLDAEFSLDGSRVVTASADHTAQIWDAATSQPVLPPFQHSDRIVCARFSPDGQRLATASWDKTARVWDLTKGKDLGIRLLHLDPLISIEFSPDGQRLLSAAGNRAQVWDVRSGGLLGDGIQQLGILQSAQFSPDGQRFVTTSTDHAARVWDALMEYQVNHQTGRPLHLPLALPLTEPFRHAGPIRCARFSPDGQRVVTASSDHTAQIWDARTGGPLVGLLQQYQTIWSAEFSPDGRRIVTASQDGNVRVWDVKTGQPLTARIKHNTSRDRYGVRFAEFGPDGQKLVTAFRNKAQILDSQTGDLLTGPFQHAGPIVAGHFSPDGQRLVTASADQTAQVWDAATAQPVGAPLRHAAAVNSSEFSSDGRWVVTASDDHTARVWDAWSGRALTDPLPHRNKVRFAQFSPDGRRVVTASQDQTARLWDAATGKPLAQPLQHQAAVGSVRFSPDGQRVVTASEDMTAVIWNAHTGQTLAAPLRHRAAVLYAEFSPDGSRVVTASLDSTIRVWEAASGLPLTEPLPQRAGAIRARFSPDGQRVLTAAGRTAQVWETPVVPSLLPTWVLSLAEAVADREVDEDGVPRPVPSSRLVELRRQVEASTAGDFWTQWARWFFADATTRTLSPSSAITVPDYVHRLIEDDTLARLREAVMLEPTNGLALAGLGLHVFLQTPDAFPRHAEEAAWYSRQAVKFAPHHEATWRLRGRIQTAAGHQAEALLGLDRALELDPRSWYTWQLKAALLVEGQRFEEAIECYDRQLPLVLSFTNSLGVFDPVEEAEVRLKRAGLLRKLGRNREAQADIRLACGIIERSPQTSARMVDLSLFYNGGLRGYWVEPDPQSGLDALPQGIQTLGGITYDVRGLVQTASSRMMSWLPRFPVEVTAIPINTKANRLHFLHAGAEGAGQAGTTIARYVFHYGDGQTRERPIQLEDDVLDWWEVPAGKAAQQVAWSGENEGSRSVGKRIHLYVTTWENPRPDVEIASFDIVSERTSVGLFLVAVTSE
jgi:WD40 repeat protein